jgi:WD40 repeat protein
MNWPTSQDYNEAVQDPSTSFSDPALKGGEVAVNAMGLPVPRSGNFADVYQFTDAAGKVWALKCFTRKVPGLKARYAKIDEHLAKARLPFTVGFQFLQQGVRVRGEWYPLLKMEWVEGFTLNDFVARNLGKPHHLHALTQMWAKLAGRLRDANMAHADLQHGNVLLVPGATPQKLGLKLIDYDGMWVPALAEGHSGEVGHPNFQHPLRLKERLYNADVDRFPHLVIAAGLRAALVGGKAVWDRFDNGDNLLFKETDFRDPAKAPVFKALWELNDPVLRTLVGHIALSAGQPLRKTPWLDDVLLDASGPKLTSEQERQVCSLLGVTTAAPAGTTAAAVAAPVEQEFNVFQFLDEDDTGGGAGAATAFGSDRLYTGRRRPPKKSKAPLFIGGMLAAGVVFGGIIAFVALNRNKKDPTQSVVQNENKGTETTVGGNRGGTSPGGTSARTGDDETEPGPGPPPTIAPIAPAGAAIAVAGLPGGKDYLFIRQGDPALYRAEGGSPRKARVVGRHTAPIRTLAAAPDGSRAVTGAEDGEVRVWPLGATAAGAPPGDGNVEMKTPIHNFGKVKTFNERWSIEAFEEGIVIHDYQLDRDATIPVGPPDRPVKGAFHSNLKANPKLPDQLGQAVTDEVNLFGGDLIVQVFEGGVQLYSRTVDKSWFSWHRKRKATSSGESGTGPGRRADYVWLDDAIPAGSQPWFERLEVPWEFIGKKDGPVHSGEKAVKLAVTGLHQVVAHHADPGLRVGRDDVLFAYVHLDPKRPPEEIMLQWQTGMDWHRAYWGANKIDWGRDNTGERRPMGPLPESGKWVRLEIKAADLGLEPGTVIAGVSLVQFDGTAYWDTIGINTATPQGAGPAASGGANPRVIKAHAGAVLACAMSTDGVRAVTVGQDRTLCEWDLTNGKPLHKVKVPDPRAVAYIPGESTVVVGTQADSAALWDLETQKRTQPLPGHKGAVRAVAVTPKGDLAFTGGEDGMVRVWRLPEGTAVGSFNYDPQGVTALAVSPDGRLAACTGPHGSVRMFDPQNGHLRANFAAKPSPGFALTFLGEGQDLVAAREPEPLLIHLQNSKAPPPPAMKAGATLALQTEADLGEGVFRLGYRPDGKVLWLRRPTGIVVADGMTGKEIKSWAVEGNVNYAAFGEGKELYAISAGGRFRAWNWETGELVHDFEPTTNRPPWPAGFFPAGKNRLLVLTLSPDLWLWDTVQWKETGRLTPYPGDPVLHACPVDGDRVALWVGGGGGLRGVIWDVAAKREVVRLDPSPGIGVFRLEASPGGKWVLGFTQDGGGQIAVWDAGTGKLAHTVKSVPAANVSGGFSPGGGLYIANESGNRRVVIDLETGQVTDEGPGFGNVTHRTANAASAAGLFATADADRKLRIWRIEKDTKPGMMTAKTPTETPNPSGEGFLRDSVELSGAVSSVAFASDNKRVFAATAKGVIHVLDPATGNETAKFPVSGVRLDHMALMPKGIAPVSGAALPERMYVLDDDKHIYVVDAAKGTKRDLNVGRSLPGVTATSQLVVAPNDTHLMVFDPSRTEAFSWDLRSGAPGPPPGLARPPFSTLTRYVAYSADGSVAAAYASGKVLVFRPRGGKDFAILATTGAPEWVGLSGEVVVAADRGRLQAWNYVTGKELLSSPYPHGRFDTYWAAMLPNGAGLVTAGEDRWLRVWDLRSGTGTELTRLRLPNSPRGVVVSPDGKTAAVWYSDASTFGLWGLPDLKAKKP